MSRREVSAETLFLPVIAVEIDKRRIEAYQNAMNECLHVPHPSTDGTNPYRVHVLGRGYTEKALKKAPNPQEKAVSILNNLLVVNMANSFPDALATMNKEGDRLKEHFIKWMDLLKQVIDLSPSVSQPQLEPFDLSNTPTIYYTISEFNDFRKLSERTDAAIKQYNNTSGKAKDDIVVEFRTIYNEMAHIVLRRTPKVNSMYGYYTMPGRHDIPMYIRAHQGSLNSRWTHDWNGAIPYHTGNAAFYLGRSQSQGSNTQPASKNAAAQKQSINAGRIPQTYGQLMAYCRFFEDQNQIHDFKTQNATELKNDFDEFMGMAREFISQQLPELENTIAIYNGREYLDASKWSVDHIRFIANASKQLKRAIEGLFQAGNTPAAKDTYGQQIKTSYERITNDIKTVQQNNGTSSAFHMMPYASPLPMHMNAHLGAPYSPCIHDWSAASPGQMRNAAFYLGRSQRNMFPARKQKKEDPLYPQYIFYMSQKQKDDQFKAERDLKIVKLEISNRYYWDIEHFKLMDSISSNLISHFSTWMTYLHDFLERSPQATQPILQTYDTKRSKDIQWSDSDFVSMSQICQRAYELIGEYQGNPGMKEDPGLVSKFRTLYNDMAQALNDAINRPTTVSVNGCHPNGYDSHRLHMTDHFVQRAPLSPFYDPSYNCGWNQRVC